MYPVDVYDIHVYDDRPWNSSGLYSAGRNLDKPWFAGEAGCAVGHIECTYDGSAALRADSWWLGHLHRDGAQSVLIENQVTIWHYDGGPNGQGLTRTGAALAAAALSGAG